MRKVYLLSAFSIVAASVAAAPYQTNDTMTLDAHGIAQCANSGGGQAMRGEMPTSFANQFWSRASCRDWSGAFEILDSARKETSLNAPNPYARETPWSKCFWQSFPFGSDARPGEDAYGTRQISHGTFVIEAEKFEEIRQAVAAACTITLGLR